MSRLLVFALPHLRTVARPCRDLLFCIVLSRVVLFRVVPFRVVPFRLLLFRTVSFCGPPF